MKDQRGQASIELIGVLPLMMTMALLMWQLHIVYSAANAVENAARTGSRVEGLGGDGKRAALRALPKSQRGEAKITVDGEVVTVRSEVPTVVPGLSTGLFKVNGSAELPG